ncbi:hypothetical protein GQ53DRAFT_866911 [Thozetella sp. PMI_491]|nr:hypothetical protein GQ53DRAFT_866911 [Thozetella sp. PMI_491]
MASPAPSPLLGRLATVWRCLSLRSDVDDIMLELLGRFSLEKIYANPSDRGAHQRLVISLLVKLNALFYLQRLTIPANNVHVGRYLGFLVSWEVALRTVEFILQVMAEGRDSLWDNLALRDKYLAECVLCALRILTLHPKPPTDLRESERRERFARVHRSLEQMCDSYPGPKSFLLEACKEVTNQLHTNPNALELPPKLKYELPNLAMDLVCLYPLPDVLSPAYISQLVPRDDLTSGWLSQFLSLRDIAHYLLGASVQCVANGNTHDPQLQASCEGSRNAILYALDNLRLPSHLSRVEMLSTFGAILRINLPSTPELSHSDASYLSDDEYELDALDTFVRRLAERQVIHRVSDRELMHTISQVVGNIHLHDGPGGQYSTGRPGLYALNCPECHLAGDSQLRLSEIKIPADLAGRSEIRLPMPSRCLHCGEAINIIREVPFVRQTWDLLTSLETNVDAVNAERHLPMQFELKPPKSEVGGLFKEGFGGSSNPGARQANFVTPEPFSSDQYLSTSQALSPLSPDPNHSRGSFGTDPWRADSAIYLGSKASNSAQDGAYASNALNTSAAPPITTSYSPDFRRPSELRSEPSQVFTPPPRTVQLATPEKGKSKWKLKFGNANKAPVGTSGDTSSLSESTLDAQKTEAISLEALLNSQKSYGGRSKVPKSIKVSLSQNSTLALFWGQLVIQVWDIGSSPPSIIRAVSTESNCILAAVSGKYLAYIIGTRDQRLTLRILDLSQPSTPIVEYRMLSSPWCKTIAIDPSENYVVVGFEQSMIRFFKTTDTEQPREDRLHDTYHSDCRSCPSVETLSFSNEGLVLLASTRSARSGLIQVYCWRFPFVACQELLSCRYPVPLHESEDNGVSSAVFRSGMNLGADLVCVTTWTQSGTPVLIQPQAGHKSEIRTDTTGRHSKLGNRIQCAAFSSSGRELAMVNDKGHLYGITNLDSTAINIRRIANSKELIAKSDSFAMSFMKIADEDNVVIAWVDPAKATGWIKKIGNVSQVSAGLLPSLQLPLSSC